MDKVVDFVALNKKLDCVIKIMKENGDIDFTAQKQNNSFFDKEFILNFSDINNLLDNKQINTKQRLIVINDEKYKKTCLLGMLINYFDDSNYDLLIKIINNLASQSQIKFCEANL